MSKLFYRFRSIKSLLEYEELEKQTIYFAPPEDLNDPMEGFKNIIWDGDEIIWKNFFKHYLYCLEHVSGLLVLAGEEHIEINEKSIPLYNASNQFSTPMYKERFESILSEFFNICGNFIKKISTRSTAIKRDELNLYLGIIHQIAIPIIDKNFQNNGFIDKITKSDNQNNEMLEKMCMLIDTVEKNIKKEEHKEMVDVLFFIQNSIQEEFSLMRDVNYKISIEKPNRNFVLIDFPQKYINSLEKLMYPNWYTACFMTKANNSSVWGHYGDSHQGICLIFESDVKESINLNGKVGFGSSGAIFGAIAYKFYEVSYQDTFNEIDFFASLGRLPIPILESTWYMNEKKEISVKSKDILENQETWRNKYWKDFLRDILIKTIDWQYENEYRLILYGLLEDEIKKEDRLLTYDFKSLKGLVFGIKTSREEKIKIIEIIERKCAEHGRDDFEFHQAFFDEKEKSVQYKKLSFIKFTNKEEQ